MYSCSLYFPDHLMKNSESKLLLSHFFIMFNSAKSSVSLFCLSDLGVFRKKFLPPVFMKNSSVFISKSLKALSSISNCLTSPKLVLCLV